MQEERTGSWNSFSDIQIHSVTHVCLQHNKQTDKQHRDVTVKSRADYAVSNTDSALPIYYASLEKTVLVGVTPAMINTMTKSKLRRERLISAWDSQGYSPSLGKSRQELEVGTEAEGMKDCFLACIPRHAHCLLMQPRTTCPARDGAVPMWSGPTYGNHQKGILQIRLQAAQGGIFSIEVSLPQITLAYVKLKNNHNNKTPQTKN